MANSNLEKIMARKFYNEQYPGTDVSLDDALAWIKLSFPIKFWNEIVKNCEELTILSRENTELREFKRLLGRNKNLLDGLREFDRVATEKENLDRRCSALEEELNNIKRYIDNYRNPAHPSHDEYFGPDDYNMRRINDSHGYRVLDRVYSTHEEAEKAHRIFQMDPYNKRKW